MFVHFDEKTMHIQIICGTLEEYSPDEDIKTIQEKVTLLRAELEKFKAEKVTPALDEIKELVNKRNLDK